MRLEGHQVRARERRQVDTLVRRASHLPQAAARNLEDPDIRRGGGAGDGHGELRSISREGQAAGDLARELRPGRHLRGGEIDKRQLASSCHVPQQRGSRALLVNHEAAKLRILAARQHLRARNVAAGVDADARERSPVAILVRAQIDRLAVRREDAVERPRRIVRRHEGLSARLQVDEIQIVVAASAQAADQRQPPVAADVVHGLQALVFRNQDALAADGIRKVGVDGRRVGAVRSHRQAASVGGPVAQVVGLLAAVRQASEPCPVWTDDEDLGVHTAAGRERQRQPIPGRRPGHAADGIVALRHLHGRAAAGRRHPHLRDSSLIRDEREPLAVRRERRRPRATDLRHASDHLDERRVRRRRRGLGHEARVGDAQQQRHPSGGHRHGGSSFSSFHGTDSGPDYRSTRSKGALLRSARHCREGHQGRRDQPARQRLSMPST